ncbi:MAG: Ig-like domain-containing protein [Acidobacteriia bacterium]|nr:Ig-like domain-containing protein [Terriglobia bacterium]
MLRLPHLSRSRLLALSFAGPALVAAAILAALSVFPALSPAQQPPAPSAARILLLPRRALAGERITLAVLDYNGRLTPGVTVTFSSGDRVTTDATGRATLAAPSTPGTFFASIAGRPGRVPLTLVAPPVLTGAGETSLPRLVARAVPRFALLADRFDLFGTGFCGAADANRVLIAGQPALVLAASSLALTILPPDGLPAGPAEVTLACGERAAPPFSLQFVALELVASSTPLAPGEKRELVVLVHGTAERVPLEARNLAPQIAELAGGNPVRLPSTGGPENSARLQLLGRSRGSFLISIRLAPSYAPPHR